MMHFEKQSRCFEWFFFCLSFCFFFSSLFLLILIFISSHSMNKCVDYFLCEPIDFAFIFIGIQIRFILLLLLIHSPVFLFRYFFCVNWSHKLVSSHSHTSHKIEHESISWFIRWFERAFSQDWRNLCHFLDLTFPPTQCSLMMFYCFCLRWWEPSAYKNGIIMDLLTFSQVAICRKEKRAKERQNTEKTANVQHFLYSWIAREWCEWLVVSSFGSALETLSSKSLRLKQKEDIMQKKFPETIDIFHCVNFNPK